MKLITILFLLFSGVAFSQSVKLDSTAADSVMQYHAVKAGKLGTAGKGFQLTGFMLSSIGGAILASTAGSTSASAGTSSVPLFIMGGVCGLTGFFLEWGAWSHLKRSKEPIPGARKR